MSQGDTHEFLIVALGASAGGLEAFENFFAHMPADAGVAFVVVQHLAPDHSSALPELLAKYTAMTVERVRDQMNVVPNHVYVIPPNTTLTIGEGVLRVETPVESRGHRMPIDTLFRSLAEECGERAVCIMLSGTGTDGTSGLRAVKEHGGMAMAQTLKSAKFDTILQSAIATGLVDHVLPVEEMPAKLMEYAAHLRSLNGKPNGIRQEIGARLGKIHGLLLRRAGHDFSQYKEGTVVRRLERRMKALQIETVDRYIEVLERQPEEADRLFKDLLIGVTQFFRDTEAFESLAREVIPKLFEGKDASRQVRVCVVGCATGEEAYSIAMLLREHASTLTNAPKLQIFATDIDERALEMARQGRYPDGIAEHIGSRRLERFFIRQENGWQVKRELRGLIIFSSHSFIKDPPFSRIDLISCRNVMIYLGQHLQEMVIPLFHYALRAGGYLFLGSSENVTSHQELFRTVDKKSRIFQRKDSLPHAAVRFPLVSIGRAKTSGGKTVEAEGHNVAMRLERLILEHYGPSCVVVNESGEAVYFSARIERYLRQPAGSPESNVVNMARDSLRTPLRASLQRAVTTQERVVQKRISVQMNGAVSHVDLTVEPITSLHANLYMILLEETVSAPQPGDTRTVDAGAEETIRHLESELQGIREDAQAAYEELETSNEELQSANEEYQSTNEELETSKEELQSTNEELETVNSELHRKIDELDHVNSDLQNLLNSTQIATIFLDSALHIKNFSPAAAVVFHLIASDVGRPVTDLAAQFADPGLQEDIQAVLGTLAPLERDLKVAEGKHLLMRILPYRTVRNVIDGVVITFVDITQLKEAEQLIADARSYAEDIVETVREPLVILDADLRVKSANRSFYDKFRVTPEEVANRPLYEISNRQWDIPEFRRLMSELLPQRKTVEGFEVAAEFANVGAKVLLLNARQIDHVELILLAIEDITERKRGEDLLRRLNEDLRYFSYAASHDLQEPLRMVITYTQLLAEEYKGKLDPQADQFIAYAGEGAHRIEGLLKGLREFWSVNEQHAAEPVPVDCNGILAQALRILDGPIRESAGLVTHDLLPTVMGEEVPLLLLFQNLIGNSVKYRRPKEQPRIHVSAEWNASLWTFSVRDNGIGIEAGSRQDIFAPFARLHGLAFAGWRSVEESSGAMEGGSGWIPNMARARPFVSRFPEKKSCSAAGLS